MKNKRYYIIFVAFAFAVVILVAYFSGGLDNFFKKDAKPKKTGNVTEIGDTELKPYDGTKQENGTLTVRFIDVGQGDCIFVNFPDGKNMLIDSGSALKYPENRAVLDKYLKRNGVPCVIDYCVATHADEDHVGNMPYVYENYTVKHTYRPFQKYTGGIEEYPSDFNDGVSGDFSDKTSYNDYLKAVNAENGDWEFFTDGSDFTNTVVYNGTDYEYTVDFMLPYAKTTGGFESFVKSNDFSPFIMLKYAGRKILFTGDAEEKAMAKFMAYYKNEGEELVDCDALKVAHHGSLTSSDVDFLDLVKPEYAVISCRSDSTNDYGHPDKTIIDRLLDIVADGLSSGSDGGLYRTDIHGTVTLTIGLDGKMTVTKEFSDFDGYVGEDGTYIKEKENEIKAMKSATV